MYVKNYRRKTYRARIKPMEIKTLSDGPRKYTYNDADDDGGTGTVVVASAMVII